MGREKSGGNKVAVINKKRGENQTTEGIQKKREYKKGGSNKKIGLKKNWKGKKWGLKKWG